MDSAPGWSCRRQARPGAIQGKRHTTSGSPARKENLRVKSHKARSTKRSVVAVSFQSRHAVQEVGQEPDGSVRIVIEEPQAF
jgi:hypothetical protein